MKERFTVASILGFLVLVGGALALVFPLFDALSTSGTLLGSPFSIVTKSAYSFIFGGSATFTTYYLNTTVASTSDVGLVPLALTGWILIAAGLLFFLISLAFGLMRRGEPGRNSAVGGVLSGFTSSLLFLAGGVLILSSKDAVVASASSNASPSDYTFLLGFLGMGLSALAAGVLAFITSSLAIFSKRALSR